MLTRYVLYLIRWQMSTPILAFSVVWFRHLGSFWATVIANFIGGLIFFWVDRYIFTKKIGEPIWAVRQKVACVDCGATGRGYRLVAAGGYDRSTDPKPEFRCERCSTAKLEVLKEQGVTLG